MFFFKDVDIGSVRLECRAHRGASAGQTSRHFDLSDDGLTRYALVGYAEDDEDCVICSNRLGQHKCTQISPRILRLLSLMTVPGLRVCLR